MQAYDVAAIRAAEHDLMAQVPEPVLMRRAAHGLAQVILALLAQRGPIPGQPVVLLVGSGNNGGDALFAGARLAGRGAAVTAIRLTGQTHAAGAAALRAAGGRLLTAADDVAACRRSLAHAAVVVDGIVGIGGTGPLRPAAVALLSAVTGAAVVAVDVPSGVDPTTGAVPDPHAAVRADVTVTFGGVKSGLLLAPGREHAGVVRLVDIGLGPALARRQPVVASLSLDQVAAAFAPPDPDAYKYSRGVVTVVAGSRTYPGAAQLVVAGARHGGVGMVRFRRGAEPEVAAGVIQRFPDVVPGDDAPPSDERSTGWAIGPGLGAGREQRELLRQVLADARPAVVDADALTLLAHQPELRELVRHREATTVLTPHRAEFARLGFDDDSDRVAVARRAAGELGAIIVLKGPATLVAAPEGRVLVDPYGIPALASAGSGDVLCGLIGATLARGPRDPATAVAAAVAVHGLAARTATDGDRPMTAWDLATAIPPALARLRG